jgi:3-methyladenine DNA glycosylase AlkC
MQHIVKGLGNLILNTVQHSLEKSIKHNLEDLTHPKSKKDVEAAGHHHVDKNKKEVMHHK